MKKQKNKKLGQSPVVSVPEENLKPADKKAKPADKKAKPAKSSDLPILSSRIKISIEGFNQNRLISTLLKDGIHIYQVVKSSPKQMHIVIDYKLKHKAFTQLEKMCYNYTVTDVSGIKPISRWLLARIGLIVGTLVFSVLAFFSSMYIWKIDIGGNEKVDSLTISRELAKLDINVGKTKSFDCFRASEAVNAIDGIAECTVEIVGTTVKVTVIESKDYIKPDGDSSIGDIVSLYDAEITRVIVSGGTGKVSIGDRVPKGDVLISKDVYNSFDEVIGETRARGSVYGKVFFSDKTIISTSVETTERTGKKKKQSKLALFGIRLGSNAKHKYSQYQAVTTKSYAFKNTFLPITLEQTTYYEVQKKIIERPIDQLIEEYKKDKLLSIIINAGGSEIQTTITKQEISQGLYSVHFYMEAEMLISQFQSAPANITQP